MANFRAIYDARYNQGGTDLAERIKAACAYVAQYILIEPTETASHAERLKWAKYVLVAGNIDSAAQTMHWLIVANASIAAVLAAMFGAAL
jgi:hypothetical protein